MKTVRPGLRTIIFGLYVILSISALIVMNRHFMRKINQITSSINQIQFVESLQKLDFASPPDSVAANSLMLRYSESMYNIRKALRETQIYSFIILLGLIVVSGALFTIVLYRLSKPLVELQKATEQIKQGNFSVHLPDTGIFEMKALKNSFNSMSNELDAVQKRLLIAEKEMMWKDISRILAHEIKHPLTPIRHAVRCLEEKLAAEPDKLQEMLPDTLIIIEQEIENLSLLAQDFGNFAKIAQPQPENFDPVEAINELINSCRDKFRVKLNLEEGHLIRFDRSHFNQIVTNILQNAIEASEPESAIEINLNTNKAFVILTIKDYGTGIGPEDLARIFEPYFSRKHHGTGLGLALVKRLVETNKAVIRVKSQPGKGSEFILIIEDIKARRPFIKENA